MAAEPTEGPHDGRGSALLALLIIVPLPSIGVWAAMWQWPGPVGTTIFALCKLLMLALPIVWLRVVDRRKFSLSPARRGGFGTGIVLGLVISAIILAAYALIGTAWIDTAQVRKEAIENGIGTLPRYLVAVGYWILVNSVLEEYVYRWFIFRKCEALMPAAWAVVVSATCFVIHHVIALRAQFPWNVTVLASLGIFIGGAVWSWMYLRFRSIWPGYVSHAIVDVTIFIIGWKIIFAGAG